MLEILKRLKQNHDAYGYRGILFAAKSRVFPPLSEVKVKAPFCPTPVVLRTRSSDISTYHQIFFDSEYDVDLAKTPLTIVDAGANVGYTSVYFAQKYPKARILAVEPEHSNFRVLRKNVRKYKNIIPLRIALWGANYDVEIADPGVGAWGFRAYDRANVPSGTSLGSVPGVTVDRLLADHGLDSIDILKVDIEGAEKEVFDDATKWIDKVGVVMIELHERIKPGCTRAVLQATADFAYEYEHGETLFLARRDFVEGRTLLTNWQPHTWKNARGDP